MWRGRMARRWCFRLPWLHRVALRQDSNFASNEASHVEYVTGQVTANTGNRLNTMSSTVIATHTR